MLLNIGFFLLDGGGTDEVYKFEGKVRKHTSKKSEREVKRLDDKGKSKKEK